MTPERYVEMCRDFYAIPNKYFCRRYPEYAEAISKVGPTRIEAYEVIVELAEQVKLPQDTDLNPTPQQGKP